MESLTLTFSQQRRLEQQLHSTLDARVYRRTLAILEVAAGETVSSVARRLRVSPRAVYHWLASYAQDHSPGALEDRDRTGRPPAAGPAAAGAAPRAVEQKSAGAGLRRHHLDRTLAATAPATAYHASSV